MPKDFTPEFITFSAKTSANQTQDLIDGKLDKRFCLLKHFPFIKQLFVSFCLEAVNIYFIRINLSNHLY